ncbi:DUF2493 domain-containing protein [bacterium]|nr:DUF2493 domain-containing protein [bacterium]
MFKVIVAGSRNFGYSEDRVFNPKEYAFMRAKLDHLLANKEHVEIVSGTAWGADRCGELYAKKRGLKVALFPAEWNHTDENGNVKINRAAGHIRNRKMGDYADALVAFRKDKSKGTSGMIEYAKKKGLQVRVFDV